MVFHHQFVFNLVLKKRHSHQDKVKHLILVPTTQGLIIIQKKTNIPTAIAREPEMLSRDRETVCVCLCVCTCVEIEIVE